MKPLLRASILLLATAFPLLAPAQATDAPQNPGSGQGSGPGQGQEQGRGMGDLAAHGVRGTITAIAGDNLTVKTEEGDVYKVETGPNTRFRKERDPIKVTDLHVGDMVMAAGDKDEKAKTVGAVFVMVIDKAQYEKARADFGKTWTAGTIQSIDETKITVKRPDNVIQTIVVDENTSFRKHRDSITLADIKVGDNVNARGALQNGNFLATVLSVGGPGGGPGGSRRPSSSDAPAPGTTQPPPNR
jgi:Domain of unknown function (DUF5666)